MQVAELGYASKQPGSTDHPSSDHCAVLSSVYIFCLYFSYWGARQLNRASFYLETFHLPPHCISILWLGKSSALKGSWHMYVQGWVSLPMSWNLPFALHTNSPSGSTGSPRQGRPGQGSVGTQAWTTSYPGYVGFGRTWPVVFCS